MILLDTHIWVWCVAESKELLGDLAQVVQAHLNDGLGVSIMSCWEVAKLVQYRRLALRYPVDEWIQHALAYPGVQLVDLTPQIVVESTQLPGDFHRDPVDQMLVATARVYDIGLLTADSKIIAYPHVRTLTNDTKR